MLLTISYSESVYLITPSTTTNIYDMLLTISYSELASPITPVEPLKPRFWDNSEVCLLLVAESQSKYEESFCIK